MLTQVDKLEFVILVDNGRSTSAQQVLTLNSNTVIEWYVPFSSY